ncbi:hypothetical protein D3C71_890510 [compost metagenome]
MGVYREQLEISSKICATCPNFSGFTEKTEPGGNYDYFSYIFVLILTVLKTISDESRTRIPGVSNLSE